MKLYRINDPIKKVKLEDNRYDIYIINESRKLEVNSAVLNVIEHLESKEKISIETIYAYISLKKKTNVEEYHKLFNFLIKYKVVVEKNYKIILEAPSK